MATESWDSDLTIKYKARPYSLAKFVIYLRYGFAVLLKRTIPFTKALTAQTLN